MNTLSIWNPIHQMDAMFHNRLASVLGGEGQGSVAWSPVVDIEETESHYVIRAELPGLSKDKVKVTVEGVKDGKIEELEADVILVCVGR